MIRECVTLAGVIYLLILVIQGLQERAVMVHAAGAAVLLIALIGVFRVSDKDRLKDYEMAALGCCILLFAGYAILSAGGLV